MPGSVNRNLCQLWQNTLVPRESACFVITASALDSGFPRMHVHQFWMLFTISQWNNVFPREDLYGVMSIHRWLTSRWLSLGKFRSKWQWLMMESLMASGDIGFLVSHQNDDQLHLGVPWLLLLARLLLIVFVVVYNTVNPFGILWYLWLSRFLTTCLTVTSYIVVEKMNCQFVSQAARRDAMCALDCICKAGVVYL